MTSLRPCCTPPGRWQFLGDPDSEGWQSLQVMMDSPQLAKMLVFGLGAQGQVIHPPDLAESVRADARALLET